MGSLNCVRCHHLPFEAFQQGRDFINESTVSVELGVRFSKDHSFIDPTVNRILLNIHSVCHTCSTSEPTCRPCLGESCIN